MKNSFLTFCFFFATTLLCFGQNTPKKINFELIASFGQASYSDLELETQFRDFGYLKPEKNVSSYTLGSNVTYQLIKNLKLVSGVRLYFIQYEGETLHSSYYFSRGMAFCGTGLSLERIRLTEHYIAVPLKLRFTFYKNKIANLYAEGGIQSQLYLGSSLLADNSSSDRQIDRDYSSSSHISTSYSVGFDINTNSKHSFFIQGTMNQAFVGNETFSTQKPFYGIEVGFGF